MTALKLATLIVLAMLAFAANSLLARMALVNTSIDPATFSVVRLVSGAAFLLLFVGVRHRALPFDSGGWGSSLALFVYAVAFSFAYVQLSAGTGALVLFGAVQGTMLCYGFTKGDRFSAKQWAGFLLACAGVVYLLLPGAASPALSGTALMAVAGVAWAVYTLSASGADPVRASAGNFARAVPFCLMLAVFSYSQSSYDSLGIVYALASGVVTSGVGYVLWYTVLPHLSVVNAATIQLSVPAIAAAMGVLFLNEALSLRLVVATIAILLGIASVLHFKRT